MKSQAFRFIISLLIAGFLGYYLGITKVSFQVANFRPQLSVQSKEPPASATNLDMQKFWSALEKVQTLYYDKSAIDGDKLLNGAISGMVESLDDPYTVYLPPVQNDDFKDNLAGKFEGIGAELGMKEKQIIVVSPLDGSPAKSAGIKSGDGILKVDDKSASGWTLAEAVEQIRGPKGTQVTLTIARIGDTKPREIKITRDEITIKSVTAWVKQVKDVEGVDKKALSAHSTDKVAYIRLSQFGDNTNQEWVGLANTIAMEKQKGGLKGVVIDVRNNPGGYLTDAVFIASEFIKSGTIVIQEAGDGSKTPLTVTRQGNLTDVPVIVLINKGSASASEILSGALRDYKRAKLLGETSFGKGTIQQAVEMGEGAGIHVTIAKWLTPNGTWVHKKGLEPDIKVEVDTKDQSHDVQLEKAILELVK